MGLGLAISTGSIFVRRTSLLTGITWWLGTQSEELTQVESNNNFMNDFNPIRTESSLGIGMLLLALLIFSIRAL